MGYADHLKMKIRHNSPIRLIFDGMMKFGLRITPFYLLHLRLDRFLYNDSSKINEGFTDYIFKPVLKKDATIIAAVQGRNLSFNEIINRLEKGDEGFCAIHNGSVVSLLWCNKRECTFKGCRFPLKINEAYFYDAYTAPAYRGKGLSSALYLLLGREVHYAEIQKVYNIIEYFNTPAIRHARKMGMQKLHFSIMIELFWKWRRNVIIRTYESYNVL